MFRWLPTLDAAPVFSANHAAASPHARQAFASELIAHLKQHGFARVRNHAVTPPTRAALFDQHRQFFALPLDAKLGVRHPGGEAPARGYSPWAYEKTAVLRPDLHRTPNLGPGGLHKRSNRAATAHGPEPTAAAVDYPNIPTPSADPAQSDEPRLLDAREQFAVGPPRDVHFPTPQLASDLLPDFTTTTQIAYQDIRTTCVKLVSAIEQGLGVPPNAISGPAVGGAGAELNLNFYPQVERRVLDYESTMRRIWPHSDLGVVSALMQDGAGASGLELQVREADEAGGAFAPVDMEQEGDLVLFVGDTLERWTNGYLRAAIHRVGLPSASGLKTVPERRSAVMFYRAPPTASLGPLPYFVNASNPARYEQVTASEYLKQHNRRLY